MSTLESKAGGRILIVDDDPMNIQIVTSVLSMSGFLVDSAIDGRQAMPRMEELQPDAVILDLMMPGRDGFELCRLIRVNPRFARTSVVIVTGLQDIDARQRGLQCGATDYILKPWKPEDLVLRVRNAVEMKRAAEELELAYKEIDKLRCEVRECRKELETSATASVRKQVALPN
ncbi:MAG: response regulator [Verrucomicrobiae bacterium]|nr:response regulator [Verrucomicrobiae bacterium]